MIGMKCYICDKEIDLLSESVGLDFRSYLTTIDICDNCFDKKIRPIFKELGVELKHPYNI